MDATGWRAWCSKAWIQGPVRRFLRQGGSSRYLSEDERIFIADRLLVRASLQSIARDLGRSPSTISRDLARNRPDSRRYHPFRAQKMAQKRRPRPRMAKLAGDDELRHYVVECLSKRWSPQQVCRALKERFPGEKHRHLAHETVYRALYHLSIRPVPAGSARLLRSGKFSRRPRSRTKVKPRQYIADALKIGDRPAHIATREEAGHWEGDLIMGKGNKSAIVTLVERSSRLLVAFALRPGNRSDNMRDQLIEALGVLGHVAEDLDVGPWLRDGQARRGHRGAGNARVLL